MKLNYPKSTIQDTLFHYKKANSIQYTLRSGRPSFLNKNTTKKLQKIIKKAPKSTAQDIQQELANTNIKVSTRTIRRSLYQLGINSRISAKKPLLTQMQQENRLTWYIEHSN